MRFRKNPVALALVVIAVVPYLVLKVLWLTGATIGVDDESGVLAPILLRLPIGGVLLFLVDKRAPGRNGPPESVGVRHGVRRLRPDGRRHLGARLDPFGPAMLWWGMFGPGASRPQGTGAWRNEPRLSWPACWLSEAF